MPSEPLDPCPVCGAEVHVDALSLTDGYGRESVLCGPATHTRESPCLYYNLVAHHHRLCAEVALARVVMAHGGAIVAGVGSLHIAAKIDAAIARVREASK